MDTRAKLHAPVLLTVATVLLLAMAAAQAHHCKGKHENDPGCPGGNDPGAEFAVEVTFDCPASGSDRSCPGGSTIADQHRLQADEASTLIDGSQDVKAIVRDSGILQFGTGAKGQKPGERSIYWDFREGVAGQGLLLGSGDVIETTDDLAADSHLTKIQVGRGESSALDFRTLAVLDSAETNLWADLAIVPSKGSKEWVFIRFEAAGAAEQCPAASNPTTVTVTRLADAGGKRRWEVVGDALAAACIQGTNLDFVFGPFRFVAEER